MAGRLGFKMARNVTSKRHERWKDLGPEVKAPKKISLKPNPILIRNFSFLRQLWEIAKA